MSYYDRIYVPKGIDVNETSRSKEYDVCLCWDFLDKGLEFQAHICSGWHNVLTLRTCSSV